MDIIPDRVLRKRLQDRCTSGGVYWADLQYDPIAGKLAIMTRDKTGEWGVRQHLYTKDGTPRQITEADINECWSSGHGNGLEDEIKAGRLRNDARAKKWAEERRLRFRKATEATQRYHTSKTFIGNQQIGGVRDSDPTNGMGYCPHMKPHWECVTCNAEKLPTRHYVSGESYTVVDNRRFK